MDQLNRTDLYAGMPVLKQTTTGQNADAGLTLPWLFDILAFTYDLSTS
jgi:hypothetical protein